MADDEQQRLHDQMAANASSGHTGLGFSGAAAPAAGASGGAAAAPEAAAAAAAAPAPAAAASAKRDAPDDDPVARARAIAAKLASSMGMGKRQRTDDGGGGGGGGGGKISKRIVVPVATNPGCNWLGLLLGPRGSNLKRMEELSGARIFLRGRGASKPGDPEENEDMYVLIEATSQGAVDRADKEVNEILYDPEKAQRLKDEQLRQLASSRDGAGGPSGAAHGANTMPLGSSGGGTSAYGPSSGDKVVMVPSQFVGLIIGKGGEQIKAIQSSTGASVQIQKESETQPGATERRVTLGGAPEAVAAADRAIQIIISDRQKELGMGGGGGGGGYGGGGGMGGGGYGGGMGGGGGGMGGGGGGMGGGGGGMGGGGSNEQTTKVPTDKVGLIIGRGGLTIRGIQDRTASHIQIPKEADYDNPRVRTVSVTGPSPQAVAKAIEEIQALLAADEMHRGGGGAGMSSIPAPGAGGAHTAVVQVPNEKAGAIIGRGGATIQGLQSRTGTRIQVPPQPEPGTQCRAVSIAGPAEGVKIAEQEIYAIISGGMGMGGGGMGMGMGGGGGMGMGMGGGGGMGMGMGGGGGMGMGMGGGGMGMGMGGGGGMGMGMGGGGMGMGRGGGGGMDNGAAEYAQLYQQQYSSGGGAASGGAAGGAASGGADGAVDQATFVKAWSDYYSGMGMPFTEADLIKQYQASMAGAT